MRLLISLLAALLAAAQAHAPPALPRQFSARLRTTAHLVDADSEYPPAHREMLLRYDYEQGLVRAEVLHGFDEGKIFVRRYDQKREYMVRLGEFAECRRAYLSEPLPAPELPAELRFVGEEVLGGKAVRHWMEDIGIERTHVFQDAETLLPVRLTHEAVEDGETVPLMTYDLAELQVGPQPADAFGVPEPHTHETCERDLGGFPYIHAFHWYLRF